MAYAGSLENYRPLMRRSGGSNPSLSAKFIVSAFSLTETIRVDHCVTVVCSTIKKPSYKQQLTVHPIRGYGVQRFSTIGFHPIGIGSNPIIRSNIS